MSFSDKQKFYEFTDQDLDAYKLLERKLAFDFLDSVNDAQLDDGRTIFELEDSEIEDILDAYLQLRDQYSDGDERMYDMNSAIEQVTGTII